MRDNYIRIGSILEMDAELKRRLEDAFNKHRQSEDDVRRRLEIELAIKQSKIPVLPQTPEQIMVQLNQLRDMYHVSLRQRIKNRIKAIIEKYSKK